MSSIISQINQINKMNDRELELELVNTTGSWHEEYKKSAYVHISGIPFTLTEGDILQVFSEFGEIVDLDLVRDPETGKSCGFGFLCYEDQRSTIIAVDNLNGIELLGRHIKVTHTNRYYRKLSKDEISHRSGKSKNHGVGIPKLLMDVYGREFFNKTSSKKDGKRSKKMTKEERKAYKVAKQKRRENRRKRKDEKRRKREERIIRREEKRRKRTAAQSLTSEELEAKKERMRKNKEFDYERRKLLLENEGLDGSDISNVPSKSESSYQMAYKYGSSMKVKESQFDMTDFKVYQYKKQQEESERFKKNKMKKEMEMKNLRLEEKEKRDGFERKRKFEDFERKRKRGYSEDPNRRPTKRRKIE